ncbi:MAG: MFS transporter [Bradymonadales bacterium]
MQNENGQAQEDVQEQSIGLGDAIKKGFGETIDTLKAFTNAPREILGLNIINVIEGTVYFGTLTILAVFLTGADLGISDEEAGILLGIFTGGITISQFFFGGIGDKLGPVKALGIALFIMLLGRFLLAQSTVLFGEGTVLSTLWETSTPLWSPLFVAIAVSLLLVALVYGLYQPSIYSLTKRFSTERTSAVSFAMLYAGMNLGAFAAGIYMPGLRRFGALSSGGTGFPLVLGVLASLAFISIIAYFTLVRGGKERVSDETQTEASTSAPIPEVPHTKLWQRLKNHPLFDLRFMFFIFILIPVQTLFAHQWLTIPAYLNRSYDPIVSDNFEFFSNLNPLIIFILAPIVAAATARASVYKMMILGTLVMAAPTFLLCIGQIPAIFLSYVLLMSIGEAMWQPRFLQHVAEIAPKDKVGAYMGIAQLPWFLTKFITSLYSGYFLANYVPETGPQDPQSMWFIYALIAMISPIALIVAKKWFDKKPMMQQNS